MLATLRQSLDSDGEPPSQHIARLNKLVERLDSRDNVAVRVLEPFILWTMHTAAGVEDWRRHSGPAVRRWLTATGEIEALCSFAGYAFDHPDDPFPEFADGLPRWRRKASAIRFFPRGKRCATMSAWAARRKC
jgi:hypothetical protein